MKVLIAILFVSSAFAQVGALRGRGALMAPSPQSAPTTMITGSITDPAGDVVSGSCKIQPSVPFSTSGGVWRVTSPTTVAFTAGAFSVALAPTDTATPSGQYYRVTCAVPKQTVSGRSVGPFSWGPETWIVPTTSGTLDISDVVQEPPAPGDPGGSTGSVQFADAEVPNGTIDGSNAAFNLTSAPSPPLSLILVRNGLIQKQGSDYTLSGASVSFVSGATPQPGDTLMAWYRH